VYRRPTLERGAERNTFGPPFGLTRIVIERASSYIRIGVCSMARIIKYDFKKTRTGRELILWQALERGQKAVLASAKHKKGATPKDLMDDPKIKPLLPKVQTPQ
jgi:hypothetical protein